MVKYPTIAKVCHYMLAHKQISARATARAVQVHHRSFQRYLRGESTPRPAVKARMAKHLGVPRFEDLIALAYRYYNQGHPEPWQR